MKPFGREVASRTVAGVLVVGIVAALAATSNVLAPYLSSVYALPRREALAWSLVATLSCLLLLVCVFLLLVLRKSKPPAVVDPDDQVVNAEDSSFVLAANSGTKPSITLTNVGDPATYWVDGKIVSLLDGSENPASAPFKCELHVGGIKGQWEAVLKDAEWANIILGSIEPVHAAGPVGKVPTGRTLVIRLGKMGTYVPVSDAGAVVELTFHTAPGKYVIYQFRVVRHGKVVDVTPLEE